MSEAEEERPVPKKKRKRPAAEANESSREWRTLDPDGRERPKFLASFPEDPDLEALIRAFEAGNFRAVRDGAPKLIDRAESPRVKRAAEELLRRIQPDPLVKFLLGVALFLFGAIVAYVYYSRG